MLFLSFLAVLGLHCCTWAFSGCDEQGLLFSYGALLLIVVASLVAKHGLWGSWASVVPVRGLSSCSLWAQLLRGMWNLPRPGIKSMSSALAGGFLTTGRPGEPRNSLSYE